MPRLRQLDKGGSRLTGKDALSEYLERLVAKDAAGTLSFDDMAFVHTWGWLLDPKDAETVKDMTSKLVAGVTTGSKRRRAEGSGPSTRAAKAGPKADDGPSTVDSLFG